MAHSLHTVDALPAWSWALPLAALVLLAAKFGGIVPADATIVLVLAAALLCASVFSSVHHAEVIALKVGEPFGSIVLAIAITVIEVALIVSIMLSAQAGSETLARDTVFATVMLVLNGIVGLCLVLGGARHHQQRFQTDASAAALSVLGTLAVITLLLPNFTRGAEGPVFSPVEAIFIGLASVVLYGVFLFVQTIRHRDYFLVEEEGPGGPDDPDDSHLAEVAPSNRTALICLALLVLSLAGVVLLAKTLSPTLEGAIAAAGLPKAAVGVVIAAIVLLPEGIAAVRAAQINHLQISLNLALGSAMATIGLTIPIVAVVALALGYNLVLGLGQWEMMLLALTLFISTVTLATGRTTILQGAVHLVIFAVFMVLVLAG
jgi:Ca2+:H+ antiporter